MKILLIILTLFSVPELFGGLAYDVMSPVVKIETSRGFGSAVAVAENKSSTTLITNWHIVENDRKVTVRAFFWNDEHTQILGWFTTEATVLISKKDIDLALIQIPAYFKLPTAPIHVAKDLRLLTPVMAVGCGMEEDVQIYRGVITDQDWDDPKGAPSKQDLIQSDAFIQPGCSGGALWAQVGEEWKVIGITVGGFIGTAMTFSIPISRVFQLLEKELTPAA